MINCGNISYIPWYFLHRLPALLDDPVNVAVRDGNDTAHAHVKGRIAGVPNAGSVNGGESLQEGGAEGEEDIAGGDCNIETRVETLIKIATLK